MDKHFFCFRLRNLLSLVLMVVGGGGWFYPAFLRIVFTAKTRHFQGYLRVSSRGHQVCGLTKKYIYVDVKVNFLLAKWIKYLYVLLGVPRRRESSRKRRSNRPLGIDWNKVENILCRNITGQIPIGAAEYNIL